jgi:hypothetical protein
MTPQDIFKKLQAKFGAERVFDLHEDPKKDKDPWFQCAPYSFEDVGTVPARRSGDCSSTTWSASRGPTTPKENQIHVTWHLYSYV